MRVVPVSKVRLHEHAVLIGQAVFRFITFFVETDRTSSSSRACLIIVSLPSIRPLGPRKFMQTNSVEIIPRRNACQSSRCAGFSRRISGMREVTQEMDVGERCHERLLAIEPDRHRWCEPVHCLEPTTTVDTLVFVITLLTGVVRDDWVLARMKTPRMTTDEQHSCVISVLFFFHRHAFNLLPKSPTL